MWNEEEMLNFLKCNLREERLLHSFGVRDTAMALANQYGISEEKAKIAGLIHDCAKNFSKEELITTLKNEGDSLDFVLEKSPHLLHGPAGAIIAKNLMGITDSDILNAIHYHTIGRKDMSLLEKIIYLADYIEPSRNFDGVDKIRDLAFKDINKALILAFENSIIFVIKKGLYIHNNTIEGRNYLISELGGNYGE